MPPIAALATAAEGGARSTGVSPGIGLLGITGEGPTSVLCCGELVGNGLLLAHAATAMPASATAMILDSIDYPSPDSAIRGPIYSSA